MLANATVYAPNKLVSGQASSLDRARLFKAPIGTNPIRKPEAAASHTVSTFAETVLGQALAAGFDGQATLRAQGGQISGILDVVLSGAGLGPAPKGAHIPGITSVDLSGIGQHTELGNMINPIKRNVSEVNATRKTIEHTLVGASGVRIEQFSRLINMVLTYQDGPGASWAPVFERLWAGWFATCTGATTAGGGRPPSEAFPHTMALFGAFVTAYTVTVNQASNIIIPYTAAPPTRLSDNAMQVLANFHANNLHLSQPYVGGQVHAWARPYNACPSFIFPSFLDIMAPPAAYNAAALNDPDAWREALSFVILQLGDDHVGEVYLGLFQALKHCGLFLGPNIMHLSGLPDVRTTQWGNCTEVLRRRLAILRTLCPGHGAYDPLIDGATMVGAGLTAAEAAAIGGLPPRANWTGLPVDEEYYAQTIGLSLIDADEFNAWLAHQTTHFINGMHAWCADDAFINNWATDGATGAPVVPRGNLTNAPPTGVAVDIHRARASGGYYNLRNQSLPLFNLVEAGRQVMCTGLDLVYARSQSFQNYTDLKSASELADTVVCLETAAYVQMVGNSLVLLRTATDFAADAMLITNYNVDSMGGYRPLGFPALDNIFRRSKMSGFVGAGTTLLEAFCGTLDAGLMRIGIMGGMHAALVAGADRITFARPELPAHCIFKVLHPNLGLGISPELPVRGGIPTFFDLGSDVITGQDPIYQFLLSEDLTYGDILTYIRQVLFPMGLSCAFEHHIAFQSSLRGQPATSIDVLPADMFVAGGVRTSDSYPSTPTSCVDALVWYGLPFEGQFLITGVQQGSMPIALHPCSTAALHGRINPDLLRYDTCQHAFAGDIATIVNGTFAGGGGVNGHANYLSNSRKGSALAIPSTPAGAPNAGGAGPFPAVADNPWLSADGGASNYNGARWEMNRNIPWEYIMRHAIPTASIGETIHTILNGKTRSGLIAPAVINALLPDIKTAAPLTGSTGDPIPRVGAQELFPGSGGEAVAPVNPGEGAPATGAAYTAALGPAQAAADAATAAAAAAADA